MLNKYGLISFILRAKNRRDIIKHLKEGSKNASDLVKLTGMYKSHVSRTLAELRREELIECLNPKDREYKFYRLTKKCENILPYLKKLQT